MSTRTVSPLLSFTLTSLRDFDASLYLCEEAFGLLPLDTLERLAGTLLLYPYLVTLLLLSGMMAVAALRNVRYAAAALEMSKGTREEECLCCHMKRGFWQLLIRT